MPDIIQSHRDIGLLNRAVSEQWPTRPEIRQKAVDELESLIEDEDPVVKQKAIDSLRQIDAHNFKMAAAAIPQLHLHQHSHNSKEEQPGGLTIEQRRQRNAERIDRLKRLGSFG